MWVASFPGLGILDCMKRGSEVSIGIQGSLSPDCGCNVTNCSKLLLPGHHDGLDPWTMRQMKHFLELLLSEFCITTTKTAPFLASWSLPTSKKKILSDMNVQSYSTIFGPFINVNGWKNNHSQDVHASLEIPNKLRPELLSEIYIIQIKPFRYL